MGRTWQGGREQEYEEELTDVDLKNLVFMATSPVQSLEPSRLLGYIKGSVQKLLYSPALRDWYVCMEGYMQDLSAIGCCG